MFKDQIIIALKKSAGVEEVNLEFSENPEFGDYSSNIALQIPATNHQSPRQRADDIVSNLKNNKNLMAVVGRIEVADPGFINFC